MKRNRFLFGLSLAIVVLFIGCEQPISINNEYIVTFVANSGTGEMENQTITSGESANLTANSFTKDGYYFTGWAKTAKGEVEFPDGFSYTMGTTNVALFAVWEVIPTYKVSFNSNGGTLVSDINNVIEGHIISKPVDPTKTDFTFAGWYKDSGFVATWNFSTDTVTADTIIYANWTNLPTYTVSFNSNGGSSVSTISNVIEGHTISEPSNPTRTDYTFSGWYEDSGFETTWNFSTDTITADTTIYAMWTNLPTYTVSFNSNGGSPVSTISNVIDGHTISEPSNPTRTDYSFSGWYKDSGLHDGWNFSTDKVIADTTLYAKWTNLPTYTVNFNSTGGSPVSIISNVIEGHTILEPSNPTRTDYTFAGWYKNSGFGTTWKFSTDIVTADTILYAMWTNLPTYTVSFNSNGGSSVSTISNVIEGHTISEPSNPTKTDYAFSGWYKDSGFVTTWNFSTDIVTADTTLYSKWTALPTYSVSFYANGGSSVSAINNVIEGHTISEPSNPTRTDYIFSGWYKDSGFGATWNFLTDTVKEDAILYAKWTAFPIYSVSFNSNGGSSVSTINNVIEGHTISEPSNPTRTDFIFSGWYKDSGFVTTWNFSTDIVTADTTLYSKWTALPTYSVSFNANGGSSVSAINNVTEGHLISEPISPTRNGYTFVNWYSDSDLNNIWDFSNNTVSSNEMLFAKWTANQYNITFFAGGGLTSTPTTKNVTFGSTYGDLATTSKNGHSFAGWWTGYDGTGTEITTSSIVNTASDLSLYAKWNTNQYTVTFDAQGGSVSSSTKIVSFLSTYGTLPTPTRTGYSFVGWWTDIEGSGTKVTSSTYNYTSSSHTIYAKWSSIGSLDLTFGVNGISITTVGSSSWGKDIEIQSDGKILFAGESSSNNGNFAIARFNSNGDLDTSFGISGKVNTDIGGYSSEEINAISLQSDGKIVAGGIVDINPGNGDADFALIRYNSNGSLDTAFGSEGIVITSFGAGNDGVFDLLIQPDGKIVAVGKAGNSSRDIAIARYNTDGSLDLGFSSDGMATVHFGKYDTATGVALQSDGKIVIVGQNQPYIGGEIEIVLLRFDTNGELDTGFGVNGKVQTSIGADDDSASDLLIQPDGKILVSGSSKNGSYYDFALLRYNIDGSLDTDFGNNGSTVTAIGTSQDYGNSVAIQSDGKILVAGSSMQYSTSGSTYEFSMIRYSSGGIVENSGIISNDFGSGHDRCYAIAIQSDGKIVLGGENNSKFLIARYIAYP